MDEVVVEWEIVIVEGETYALQTDVEVTLAETIAICKAKYQKVKAERDDIGASMLAIQKIMDCKSYDDLDFAIQSILTESLDKRRKE